MFMKPLKVPLVEKWLTNQIEGIVGIFKQNNVATDNIRMTKAAFSTSTI